MKPARLLVTLCLLLLTVGSVSLAAASEPAAPEVVRLTGEHLQVGVDNTSGQIVEFIDRASRHNFAGNAPQLGGLWQIELANRVTLTATNARRLEVLPQPKNRVGLGLRWSEFDLPSAPGLSVDVVVRLEMNLALSRWQIQVHKTRDLSLSLIRFPRLLNIPEQPRERLAVPVWLGQELENPRTLFRSPAPASHRSEWSYPGLLSMQCLALTSENGPGLYVACDDAAGQLKNFAVFGRSNAGFNLEIVHQPETDRTDRDGYVLPYYATLGIFSGDWFSAATLYRAWATNPSWALASRLKRGLVPAWTTNTALWIWNRGPSPGVLDPAIVLKEKLGLPVSVFWHWWHGCAYDAGFPEYLPPREGMASFQAALAKAQARDIHAIVYMNQRLWGMATASWTNENAARFAVKAQDGQIKPEVYNTFTKSPCASMCMGTEFWRKKYAGLAARAINELGVDGIYMDQACSSLACFDPSHGHAIGGGTYWMSGFKLLASDIRRRSEPRRAPALAGEGCGENWLPYLDLMLALQVSRERYAGPDGWETIPFAGTVALSREAASSKTGNG